MAEECFDEEASRSMFNNQLRNLQAVTSADPMATGRSKEDELLAISLSEAQLKLDTAAILKEEAKLKLEEAHYRKEEARLRTIFFNYKLDRVRED